MDRHGNTSAASIPVALNELAEAGKLTPGQRVACIGFGGGLTWGGAILTVQRVERMKLLNEILGTKYPIIQGGMANIATGEFAAACSNAGALGLIGAGGMRDADTLRENIRRCKAVDRQALRRQHHADAPSGR